MSLVTPDASDLKAPAVSAVARLCERLDRRPWLYWLIVVLHLVPIWSFRYLPTQDGPAHLANAVILKDFGVSGMRYNEFYEVRWEAIPNWTVHLLLVGLMHLVPPLIAEKVVVSLYVVGLAWAFRFLQQSLGQKSLGGRSVWVAVTALLFVFPRFFWMGFYNWCLSVVLLFIVLGFCVRRREWTSRDAALLCLLLLTSWFTHLAGFLLAIGGAIWLAGTQCEKRAGALASVALAALPGCLLTVAYFLQRDFFGPGGTGELGNHLQRWLRATEIADNLGREAASVPEQIFEPYGQPLALVSGLGLALCIAWLIAGVFGQVEKVPSQGPCSRRWPVGLLGVAVAILYFLVPDHFAAGHGGHLKSRLAPLPFLVWLASCRPPPRRMAPILGVAGLAAIGLNLTLIWIHIARAQADLNEFTAAVEHVGNNRVLFVSRGDSTRKPVNYLEHAADYYCLRGGNINLDNHEAETRHFPIRFRPGISRGWGELAAYPNRHAVDQIIVWAAERDPSKDATDWRLIFQQGRLTLWARDPGLLHQLAPEKPTLSTLPARMMV